MDQQSASKLGGAFVIVGSPGSVRETADRIRVFPDAKTAAP